MDKDGARSSGGNQASAADPADHPAADAGAGAVAGSGAISRDILTQPQGRRARLLAIEEG